MGGHLFVVRGDLRDLACDAIFVPSGSATKDGRVIRGEVQDPWPSFLGLDGSFVEGVPQDDSPWVWCREPASTWPEPSIWIGNTGEDGRTPERDAAQLQRFVKEAGAAARAHARDDGLRPLADARPLVAVPLIGTGRAGRAGVKGEVVVVVVRALAEAADAEDVDVVLVLRDDAAYSAAQQARQRMFGELTGLSGSLEAQLARLVEEASAGRLVLFLGAGVSMGAGLPSWSTLLDALIGEAELDDLLDPSRRAGLDSRDVATLIAKRLSRRDGVGEEDALARAVRRVLNGIPDGVGGAPKRVSLLHQLLASLPVTEAITTNYDGLFEQARSSAGRPLDVLPGTPKINRSWLLKLHGSLEPETARIVLARSDYLRLEEQGPAFAALVQAMLLTRHLLFVGYSLNDDNFHRMVHQVRRSVTAARADDRIGTVLTPNPLTSLTEIWEPEFEFVSTAVGGLSDPRRQAIFLDCLACAVAAPGQHLLDDTYRAVFSEDEQQLAVQIKDLLEFSENEGIRVSLQRQLRDVLSVFRPTQPDQSGSADGR